MERRELELDGPRTNAIDFFVPTHSHPRLFTFVKTQFLCFFNSSFVLETFRSPIYTTFGHVLCSNFFIVYL